jgi:TRAP-type C4-dicarboxylate transport system substrate-binding protein
MVKIKGGYVMKRLSVFLAILVGISLLMVPMASCSSSTPQSTSAAAVVLRAGYTWPAGDDISNGIQALADGFNARTGGKYIIETHPGESIVKMNETMDAVRTGAVEIGGYPSGPFSGLDPIFAAAEMPFLYNTAEGDAAAQVGLMSSYSAIMEKKFNQKAISGWTVLGLEICSVNQIKTLADWKGLLIQSISPQNAKMESLLGASPVSMTFPEAYQAMQKKIVSATMQSTSMVGMFKLYEVAKFETIGYLMPAAMLVSINLDAYNKLPKDVQAILVEEGLKAQINANDFMVKRYASNLPALEKFGMTVYKLPKAERDSWKAQVQPYIDELFSQMDPTFAAKVKSIANEANAKYPYPN